MKLYLFNPDSDLALANNETNYIAPVSARRMAQDLALLPVWYADPYNAVLEVKYNGFLLSYIKDLVSLANRSEFSVSKYCLSRSAGLHYQL